ncbi:hypothetical protein LZ199_27995 [Myxococcus sp. QH3KD-4-1]|nr:hypothetical protein [Myxococcus qinghaiensis]
MARHPRLVQAAADAVEQEGLGAMMSSLFQRGAHPRHTLERGLAALLRAESGVLCQSGYCANVGLPECLADEQVPVYIDRMAHMSLWRGIRSAGARRQRLHANAAYLRGHLEALGYDLDGGAAQILALQSGLEVQTLRLKDALEARGIFGSVFCDPATPVKHSLVRLSVHSELSRDDLDHVVDACREIREEVGLSSWASTRRHEARHPAALPA